MVFIAAGQRLEHDVCEYPRVGKRLFVAGEMEGMWIGRKGRAKCSAIERSAQPIDPCSELLHAAGAHAAQPIGAFCRTGDSSGAKRIGAACRFADRPALAALSFTRAA